MTIEVYDSNSKVETYSIDVEENGTFEKEMNFDLLWEKDVHYKLIAKVTTGADYYDEDTEYIEVTSPQVEFTMVGSDGTWNTGGMHISDDASFTSYEITAVIFSPGSPEVE